jgi:Cu-Zn family superoxide dismutase
MKQLSLIVGLIGLVTTGLSAQAAPPAPVPQGATAKATIKDAQGQTLGDATLRETPNGVLLSVNLQNVPAGTHAFHIHTTGLCEAPTFMSAGGHFAPGGTHHGLLAQAMPHAGDLPNLHVAADGKLSFEVLAANVTLAPGPRSLFDADGSALVLHAMADDYVTDPAGNAGARIACGTVTR